VRSWTAALVLGAALVLPGTGAAALLARLPLDEAERTFLRARCDGEALCIARVLVRRHPRRFRIEPAPPYDTDRIRWVVHVPSLGPVRRLADGRLLVPLRRFGRTLWRELKAADLAGRRVVLDLRDNGGGDLRRALELAARLLGPARARVVLHRSDAGRTVLSADRPAPIPAFRVTAVLISGRTASSAEVLAALLRVAGARLCGRPSFGKDRLEMVLPLPEGLRLRVALGRLVVPGRPRPGPLVPDGPLAACGLVPGPPGEGGAGDHP